MDAQTEFAAEIFKTLTQEQKDAILVSVKANGDLR